MGFWIFMLVMELLIPLSMIGFGKVFSKKSPKKINMTYGYRTTMSMKSRETWEFAHGYFGRLWYILGWILLPISIIVMLFVIGKEEDVVGTVGMVLEFIQMVVLILPIIPTERELRRRFDKNGKPKEH